MTRRISIIRIAIVLFAMFFVVPIVYMSFDNVPPYVFESGRIVPDPALSGQQVNVVWHLKIQRFCEGTVYRKVTGPTEGNAAIIHYYDPVEAILNKRVAASLRHDKETLDQKELVLTFTLPTADKGSYLYTALIEYRCNLLQHFFPLRTQLPIVPFTMIDKPLTTKK